MKRSQFHCQVPVHQSITTGDLVTIKYKRCTIQFKIINELLELFRKKKDSMYIMQLFCILFIILWQILHFHSFHIFIVTQLSLVDILQPKKEFYAQILSPNHPQKIVFKNPPGTILNFQGAHADFRSICWLDRTIYHVPDQNFQTRRILINKKFFSKRTGNDFERKLAASRTITEKYFNYEQSSKR